MSVGQSRKSSRHMCDVLVMSCHLRGIDNFRVRPAYAARIIYEQSRLKLNVPEVS